MHENETPSPMATSASTEGLCDLVASKHLAIAAKISGLILQDIETAKDMGDAVRRLAPDIDRSLRISRNSVLLVKLRDRLRDSST